MGIVMCVEERMTGVCGNPDNNKFHGVKISTFFTLKQGKSLPPFLITIMATITEITINKKTIEMVTRQRSGGNALMCGVAMLAGVGGLYYISDAYIIPMLKDWYFKGADDDSLIEVLEGNNNGEECEELVCVSRPHLVLEDEDEPKAKRRIHNGRKGKYAREIIAAVKSKFGTPKPTEANLRAVRRYATEIMREHNLRHTQIQIVLPKIVAASFVPDKYELSAMRIAGCYTAQTRKGAYAALLKRAGFRDC